MNIAADVATAVATYYDLEALDDRELPDGDLDAFTETLLDAVHLADTAHRGLLALGFPAHIAAFEMAAGLGADTATIGTLMAIAVGDALTAEDRARVRSAFAVNELDPAGRYPVGTKVETPFLDIDVDLGEGPWTAGVIVGRPSGGRWEVEVGGRVVVRDAGQLRRLATARG